MRLVPFSSLGCGSEKVIQTSLTSPSAKKFHELNLGPEKATLSSPSLMSWHPAEPVALDVHADEVAVRMTTGQAHSVLALAAPRPG